MDSKLRDLNTNIRKIVFFYEMAFFHGLKSNDDNYLKTVVDTLKSHNTGINLSFYKTKAQEIIEQYVIDEDLNIDQTLELSNKIDILFDTY